MMCVCVVSWWWWKKQLKQAGGMDRGTHLALVRVFYATRLPLKPDLAIIPELHRAWKHRTEPRVLDECLSHEAFILSHEA